MFSGGVDSTVCLEKLVRQGIKPILFYFHTDKMLLKSFGRKIREIARYLSPSSPFYTFWTHSYSPTWLEHYPYYAVRLKHNGKNKWLYPLNLADKVAIGYTRFLYYYDEGCSEFRGSTQEKFIEFCKLYKLPYLFPLADMRRKEVDVLFQELPEYVKERVVSTTRGYDYGGRYYVVPP